jgi:protein TonB
MRATLFILLLILSFNISAQQDSNVVTCYMLDGDIRTEVDTIPKFPGGNENLFNFLGKNLKHPTCDACNNGTVYTYFIINEDGSISDIKILKGINNICDKAAIDVIKIMPNWIPGVYQDKKVKVYYSIPIKFSNIK